MAQRCITKSIGMYPEEWALVDRLAEAQGRNRSRQIAWLIKQAEKLEKGGAYEGVSLAGAGCD